MDMIQSFRDIWILGWDSVLVPVDALLASVGTGGLTVPTIADRVCLAARSHRDVASDRDHCGGDGGAVSLAVDSLCAMGVVMHAVMTHSFTAWSDRGRACRVEHGSCGVVFSCGQTVYACQRSCIHVRRARSV